MEVRQRPRLMARYAEIVVTPLCTKGGRCQGRSNGERSRRDGAPLAVAVIRRKVGRLNAARGARIDGAKAGGDGKVGVLCVGDPRNQERKQDHFEPLVMVGAIALRAICPDERREPEKQHECAIEALRPMQRHTIGLRRFLDGLARSVLARVRLVEAEEEKKPDSPSSTSRLRPSSPTPTCSLRPVSLRARKHTMNLFPQQASTHGSKQSNTQKCSPAPRNCCCSTQRGGAHVIYFCYLLTY